MTSIFIVLKTTPMLMGCLSFLCRFLLYREELSNEAECFNLGQFQSLHVTSSEMATATRQDPTLSEVLLYAQQEWPAHVPESMQPFRLAGMSSHGERPLSIVGKLSMIIPLKLRTPAGVTQGHGGIVRMKSLARSYFWWPGLDKNDEELFKSC